MQLEVLHRHFWPIFALWRLSIYQFDRNISQNWWFHLEKRAHSRLHLSSPTNKRKNFIRMKFRLRRSIVLKSSAFSMLIWNPNFFKKENLFRVWKSKSHTETRVDFQYLWNSKFTSIHISHPDYVLCYLGMAFTWILAIFDSDKIRNIRLWWASSLSSQNCQL